MNLYNLFSFALGTENIFYLIISLFETDHCM